MYIRSKVMFVVAQQSVFNKDDAIFFLFYTLPFFPSTLFSDFLDIMFSLPVCSLPFSFSSLLPLLIGVQYNYVSKHVWL